MTRLVFLSLLSSLGAVVNAQAYTNPDIYLPSNFFSKFNFFTDADPTHGYVEYVE